jgi:hypothetical protein
MYYINLDKRCSQILKENIKMKLRVFERKILRRIFGPVKEKDGTWRIKTNEELERLIDNNNIINYIKAQRLARFGHVHRMPENSMVTKIFEWSPAATRSIGRPNTDGRMMLRATLSGCN